MTCQISSFSAELNDDRDVVGRTKDFPPDLTRFDALHESLGDDKRVESPPFALFSLEDTLRVCRESNECKGGVRFRYPQAVKSIRTHGKSTRPDRVPSAPSRRPPAACDQIPAQG